MSRQKARHEAHVRLYRHEHESPAYLSKGKFTRKARHATEYALTNEPIDNANLATKDFMRWRPQKNTVLTVDTVGTHSEYRGAEPNGKQQRDGTHSGYRGGSNKSAVGTHSECTDTDTTVGGDGWLAEYGGWPCKNKGVLNACCLVCGVWITSGRYEFDGGKHSCDPVSRAKYRERFHKTTDEQAAA